MNNPNPIPDFNVPNMPNLPKRLPNPFLPLSLLLSDVSSKIARALPQRIPSRSRSQSLCTLPSQCEDNQCNWFASMLQNLVPPANARSQSINSLDAYMSDLNKADPQAISTMRHPAVERIVAIGDIHGDVHAMRHALQNAGVLGEGDEWTGGKTVLVQVGDQLDRGNREREIYKLLFKLQDTAPEHGGAVHLLLGNHEIMNTRLDFRYVTERGFQDFDRDGGVTKTFGVKKRAQIPSHFSREIRALPSSMRARARALVSGGSLAMELAERAKVAVIVGDNVFVHAGLKPVHVMYGGHDPQFPDRGLKSLNADVKAFLLGKAKLPSVLRGGKGPTWMREYSRPGLHKGSEECRMLSDTLKMLKAKRMIVGHTIQQIGINSACGGRVWRIDTGMSSYYGGEPEAIEISRRGAVKIHTGEGVVQGSARYR